MDYVDFAARNLMAVEATRFQRFSASEVPSCNEKLRYRGFVNCQAAKGEDSFVMFTNADDVVAGHYMYAGPASFETGTLKLWCHLSKRSEWVFDVGAFTGVFSLAAATANPSCRVMAFEPSFVTYSRLLVNIFGNELDSRISPMRFGLGMELGELELRHPSGVYVMASGESFLNTHISDPWFTEKVPVISLDHLLGNQEVYRKQIVIDSNFDRVDLIKIDVEGFEIEVLKGMREVIARDHPIAIVEILDTESIGSVLDLFGSEYHMKHIDEDSGRLMDRPTGTNKLFIHRDQLGTISDYI
ncbi:FkbM family methyltransferase [Sphingomonas sp. MMSM20]|uniref:FkbM family methyltransferase n=1 Tax=Sphingomonas lycopersici TaxID=2951807 RepID=UPI00223756F5|nr:FkbM family methyltransferase [Sphingomonas lycopersici]MCW6531254.1 FkbM family methyltransferase [Sphingomonas lycopersici]